MCPSPADQPQRNVNDVIDDGASDAVTEYAMTGLHDFLESLVPPPVRRDAWALDVGTGAGGIAQRLQQLGYDKVTAVDRDSSAYRAAAPFVQIDLDAPTARLPGDQYSLITAVEVIEHLESPVRLLRMIATSLADDGLAIVTTPNVDNIVARIKFLWRGTIRSMDASSGDPTHISPVFWDLFHTKYLPRAGLRMVQYRPYPHGLALGSKPLKPILALLGRLVRRPPLIGDVHVFILEKAPP